ncbi:MAG: class I SAM-dependent methyltransferase [Eubacterium sp.]|nr:class I SAM-dependent methyltransferase [Eubacterium sp.]
MLSKRLKTVADLVTPCDKVADVGTDHGYVPIYLVKENIARFCYAMDVNEGPLTIAKSNIASEGLEDKIETLLSDGFDSFGDREADTVIIAGMGGDLIVDILTRAKSYEFKELILSPHKRVDLVRKYLMEGGYEIIDEIMIEDAEKYYPVIKACKGEANYSDVELEFGPKLLSNKDETLKAFLDKEYDKFSKIKDSLKEDNADVDEKLKIIKEGLNYYV